MTGKKQRHGDIDKKRVTHLYKGSGFYSVFVVIDI